MTAADLDDNAAVGGRDSGPIAVVSRGALRANARLLSGPIAGDLPADAWGHGEVEVRAALRDASTPGGAEPSDFASAVDTLLGVPGGDARSRPAMRLVGGVLSTKALREGEGVSYGLTFRAAADTRIALVTGGYAQGVVRALGNRIAVSIGGRRHAVVGRIAMDVCVVDIGDAVVGRGDEVVFFGDERAGEPGIASWSAATGMPEREILTAIGLHARREYAA